MLGTLFGAVAAAYVNRGYENVLSPSINNDSHSYVEALFAEIIISCFLVMCVLSVGTSAKVAGNSYFGLAIGFVVIAGMISVGDILSSNFNPAYGVVLPVLCTRNVDQVWVFVIGDVFGSVIAVTLYTFWHDILKIQPANKLGDEYQQTDREYLKLDQDSGMDPSGKSPLLR